MHLSPPVEPMLARSVTALPSPWARPALLCGGSVDCGKSSYFRTSRHSPKELTPSICWTSALDR
ncbi:hypothetical protein ACFT7S_07750 [Streptomyces sp. NPDC057136]|uniref:hypothetical protein n=1 Tax=Streptomyces sp. NPDC057136 TaxID=3346029 RepID=UPI0036267959